MQGETHKRPLNVSFKRGSKAERVYRQLAGLPETEALAPGLKPHKTHDLHFHGGKTIADLHFKNFYLDARYARWAWLGQHGMAYGSRPFGRWRKCLAESGYHAD